MRRTGGISVFVGGPIQHAFNDPEVFDPSVRYAIETLIRELSAAGFTVFSAHVAEEFGDADMSGQSAAIVSRDHRWMLDCRAYVCVLPADSSGHPIRTDGTYIELGWASMLGRLIVAVVDSRVLATLSEVLKGLPEVSPIRFMDLAAVLSNPASLSEQLKDWSESSRDYRVFP